MPMSLLDNEYAGLHKFKPVTLTTNGDSMLLVPCLAAGIVLNGMELT